MMITRPARLSRKFISSALPIQPVNWPIDPHSALIHSGPAGRFQRAEGLTKAARAGVPLPVSAPSRGGDCGPSLGPSQEATVAEPSACN